MSVMRRLRRGRCCTHSIGIAMHCATRQPRPVQVLPSPLPLHLLPSQLPASPSKCGDADLVRGRRPRPPVIQQLIIILSLPCSLARSLARSRAGSCLHQHQHTKRGTTRKSRGGWRGKGGGVEGGGSEGSRGNGGGGVVGKGPGEETLQCEPCVVVRSCASPRARAA